MFEGPANGLALDLGSGEGRDTAFFAEAGLRVTARDLAPTRLDKTRASRTEGHRFGSGRQPWKMSAILRIHPAPTIWRWRLMSINSCAVGVFSPAMAGWGTEIDGFFTATADELLVYFPKNSGWLPLDRMEYWIYRLDREMMASFAYVIARKQDLE